MSKAVKNMLVDDLKQRLEDVGDVIVVSLGQLDAQQTTLLRQRLRKKEISLRLVKNSLAKRAMAGTPLEPAMEDAAGMLALAWGGEDIVDLAKELDRLTGDKAFEGFACRGGALDGGRLGPDEVKHVATWPTRGEQLSLLSGQISSLGGLLSGQITGAGGMLAGQLASHVESLENEEAPAA